MKSDIAKSERLGMYGRGIERIKLKKAAGIMQKNWKGNMDTVEIEEVMFILHWQHLLTVI